MADFLDFNLFIPLGDQLPKIGSKLLVVPGIQGDEGQIGLQGPPGQQGLQGIQGADGKTGERGQQGNQGDTGKQGISGPRGPKGVGGNKGDTGNTGERGQQGIPGENGKDGKQGDTGPAGTRGIPGPVGPSFSTSNFSLIDDITLTYNNKYIPVPSAGIQVVAKTSTAVLILSGSGGFLPTITEDSKKVQAIGSTFTSQATTQSFATPAISSIGQYGYYQAQSVNTIPSGQPDKVITVNNNSIRSALLNFRILVNGIPSSINSCGTVATDGRWNISYTSHITLIRDTSNTIILEWMITSGTAYCSAFSDRSTSHINMILLW
jgi:hypothetical protein